MSIVSDNEGVRANECTFTIGSDLPITSTDGSDDLRWFAKAARALLSPDAGLALHYLTGVPESTCYRYARGDSQPSVFLVRKLLHGPQGATWLNVVMDGCTATWWLEWQAVERRAAKLDEIRLKLEGMLSDLKVA